MTTALPLPDAPTFLSGPLTEKCPFCGAEILTLAGAFVQGDPEDPQYGAVIGLPGACDCEASKHALAAQKAEEEARQASGKRKEKQALLERRVSESGMPPGWIDRGLRRWAQGSSAQRMAYSAAVAFGEAFCSSSQSARSLFVVGDIGAGKTFLASCLSLDIMRRGGRVKWANVGEVLREIRDSFRNEKLTEREVISWYTSPALLVLDDLGKERPTEWAMEQLFAIINARYDAEKPMIVTTNYGGEDLVKRLTPRPDASGYTDDTSAKAIVDRLRSMSTVVKLEGRSLR